MRYFSWDRNKAKSNLKKHGVDFEDAVLVFDDPFVVTDFDWIAETEVRWHAIGMVRGSMLLLVVHMIQENDGDEYIRIISARRATSGEERKYISRNRELGHL